MVSEKTLEGDTQLHDYELILIFKPEITDEALDALLNNISQFISGNGGTVSDTEKWGIRKLAYPVEKFLEGNYVLTRFRLKPSLSKELEAKLKISEDVIRRLLTKLGS